MKHKLIMEAWRKFIAEDIDLEAGSDLAAVPAGTQQYKFGSRRGGPAATRARTSGGDDGNSVFLTPPVGERKEYLSLSPRHSFGGARGRDHKGIDVGWGYGLEVKAAHSGKVVVSMSGGDYKKNLQALMKNTNTKWTWKVSEDLLQVFSVKKTEGGKAVNFKEVRKEANKVSKGFAAGMVVRIYDTPNGVMTKYFHLSNISVDMDQTVNAGDIIGNVGRTGMFDPPSDGGAAHLHFEVWKDGAAVDPVPFLTGQ